ncbi:C45 family autoproteolytic acyltransferase/hydolase [Desulfatirhabdium butyrativorans]|uniref:C45 family autoproteolytic acyltransferase/hydolase n=1 Tax=Desulfatirhabdium butyrativorans TaxID=340467 RepID=UPI0004169E53|nr:C45 family peptidase [Desulfatirhabdium butyrativorans]
MRKISLFMIRILIVILATPSVGMLYAESPSPGTIHSFEGGTLRRAGAVNVLSLHGSYRRMGRQYGHLLRRELHRLYQIAIVNRFINKDGFTYQQLLQTAKSMFATYPYRYKEILYGMAQTSGLGLDRQLLLNFIEWYPKLNVPGRNCSGMAVWGEYTGGGPLIFGRNNDDSGLYREFAPFLTVAAFNGDDGAIPAAIINYAGVIYAASGINSRGVFLEMNSGDAMGYYSNRLSILVSLFGFLQDFSGIEDMDAAFHSSLVNLSSIINVADSTIAYSYECPTTFPPRRRSPDQDGILVATNHFVEPDPSWNLPQQKDDETTEWTITRRKNLLARGEEYKGLFDVDRMKEILEMTIEEGGATSASNTIYQIIAVPGEMRLWVRAPECFSWQEVNLKEIFQD